jgi:hypothetical protein
MSVLLFPLSVTLSKSFDRKQPNLHLTFYGHEIVHLLFYLFFVVSHNHTGIFNVAQRVIHFSNKQLCLNSPKFLQLQVKIGLGHMCLSLKTNI